MKDAKKIILAIDDNVDFLNAEQALLEANGYIIVTATTAEEGLKKYKQQKPDLIIVDLMMEEVDAGANFVKELKLMNNQVPVFLLSGAGDGMSASTDYAQMGFSGVFQKPLDGGRLLALIRSKLSS
jgi:DNA-binding response OmpR family regulator